MAMCNIPSTNTDPQYRYKMPKIVSKIEGRGNGIKTCVVNMGDVARALYRPPQYTTKWFGNELGAQSNYTNKEGEGERAVINGAHETHVFQTLLDKFIEKYVLCPNCNLPEIPLQIKKSIISAKCAACGWSGELDNTHRLAAFITKNPPDGKGGVVNLADGKSGPSKEERRKLKEEARKKAQEGGGDGSGAEEEAEVGKKSKKKKDKGSDDEGEKKSKKDKKDKKDKKEKKKKEKADSDDDSDEEKVKKDKKDKKDKKEKKKKDKGSDDEKEKKSKKEKKDKKDKKEKKEKKEKKKKDDSDSDDAGSDDEKSEKSSEAEKEVVPLEYDDDEIKSTIKSMADFVESKGGKPTVAAFFEEVRALQVTKVFDDKIRLYAVLESLFGADMDAKGVTDKSKIIEKFIQNGRLQTADVLWAFDTYIEANKGWDATRRFPPVVKVMFDEEWCSDQAILRFYNEDEGEGQPGFDKAKAAAKPILAWLAKDDDSDSEEDSDEDSD